MQKEKFLIIPNSKELELFDNFSTFILPLKDYSIGFNVEFDYLEINEIAKSKKVYVIMNKFLHMKLYDFEKLYKKFNTNIMFIVEDIGLVNIIDKKRLVLYENHILSNYKAINFLSDLNIKNVVINNDLTIQELMSINDKTKSNIYYFYVAKNMIMYSRRNLVSNYNKHFNINNVDNYLLSEKVTHKELEINESNDGSIVRYHKIFCASKYLNDLKDFNLIIDFTNLDEISTKMIIENYNKENLYNLIDSDYYFLENEIKYKVGDLK